MSLPELLRELSSALQSGSGRIRVRRDQTYGAGLAETLWVVYGGSQSRCGIISPAKFSDFENPFTLLHLEAALREECEARGWNWAVGRDAGNRAYASVMPTPAHRPPCFAPTPAEALAAAMVSALKAGKGEG